MSDQQEKEGGQNSPPVPPAGEEKIESTGRNGDKRNRQDVHRDIMAVIAVVISAGALLTTRSGLNIATSSLQTTQKQFLIANSPVLNLGRIEYIYFPGQGAPPLTAGKARGVRIGVNNISDKIVHVYEIRYRAIFDTTYQAREQLFEQMQNSSLDHRNGYLGKGVGGTYETPLFSSTISVSDCIKMDSGVCVLYLEVIYQNPASEKRRSYIALVKLRDHFYPTKTDIEAQRSLLDDVYYNENLDSGEVKTPIPR